MQSAELQKAMSLAGIMNQLKTSEYDMDRRMAVVRRDRPSWLDQHVQDFLGEMGGEDLTVLLRCEQSLGTQAHQSPGKMGRIVKLEGRTKAGSASVVRAKPLLTVVVYEMPGRSGIVDGAWEGHHVAAQTFCVG